MGRWRLRRVPTYPGRGAGDLGGVRAERGRGTPSCAADQSTALAVGFRRRGLIPPSRGEGVPPRGLPPEAPASHRWCRPKSERAQNAARELGQTGATRMVSYRACREIIGAQHPVSAWEIDCSTFPDCFLNALLASCRFVRQVCFPRVGQRRRAASFFPQRPASLHTPSQRQPLRPQQGPLPRASCRPP